jgi:hypothetical protein
VTSYQVENALRDAFRRGYDDLIFAGFSFDAQAQETIAAENERKGAKMRLHMAQIRPDVGMKDLLKKTNKVEQIFTVFGQPRTSVRQISQGRDGSPSRPQNAAKGGAAVSAKPPCRNTRNTLSKWMMRVHPLGANYPKGEES